MRSSMTGSSVWNLHRIPSISMASCIRFVCQIHGKETTVICSFYFCAVPNFQYRQLLLIQDKATGEHPSIKESSADQESVLDGFISVKPYESKGFVLDLPRILRILKRRFSRNDGTKSCP